MFVIDDSMNKFLGLNNGDEPQVPLGHSEKCRKMFREIADGVTCVYLCMEDADELCKIACETGQKPEQISFSLLSDAVIQYDAQFFRNTEQYTDQVISRSYRPYFLSFIVSGEMITVEQMQMLRSGWFECIHADNGTDSDKDGILLTGTLVTSASPVSRIENWQLRFTNRALPATVLADIHNTYDPSLFPICGNVQKFLEDAWEEDTIQYIDIYNVGKGNADYICGKKHRILYDIGYDYMHRPKAIAKQDPFSKAVAAIRNLKPHCVILSHWDLDHIIGCAYAPQRIFTVKWIAPTLDKDKINAIRLARYLNIYGNLALVDRKQKPKLVARIVGPKTQISLWLGSGKDKRITPANCHGLFLELFDHDTEKNILLAGDVPYICMPGALFEKTIHFLHVPHHCSKMNLSPLRRGDKLGIGAVITSYNHDKARDKKHDGVLKKKYRGVYYITKSIHSRVEYPLAERICRPFDFVIER